jgi:hypothetical protein
MYILVENIEINPPDDSFFFVNVFASKEDAKLYITEKYKTDRLFIQSNKNRLLTDLEEEGCCSFSSYIFDGDVCLHLHDLISIYDFIDFVKNGDAYYRIEVKNLVPKIYGAIRLIRLCTVDS